jgi:hypothetical protein
MSRSFGQPIEPRTRLARPVQGSVLGLSIFCKASERSCEVLSA